MIDAFIQGDYFCSIFTFFVGEVKVFWIFRLLDFDGFCSHEQVESNQMWWLVLWTFGGGLCMYFGRFCCTVRTSSALHPWKETRWSSMMDIRLAGDLYLHLQSCFAKRMFKYFAPMQCRVWGRKKTNCSLKNLSFRIDMYCAESSSIGNCLKSGIVKLLKGF